MWKSRLSSESSRHRNRGLAGCRRLGNLGTEELTAPDLDAHQSKNRVRAVDAAGAVVGDQTGDSRRIEQATTAQRVGGQRVVNELAQLVTQPGAQRRAESGLGPIDHFARQEWLHGLLEDPLAFAPALFEVRRQT